MTQKDAMDFMTMVDGHITFADACDHSGQKVIQRLLDKGKLILRNRTQMLSVHDAEYQIPVRLAGK